jgi:hypothetical protein
LAEIAMKLRIQLRRRKNGALFVHPMDPMPRTAILAPGFQQTKLTRVFPGGWNEAAERFQATSIAGPLEQLHRLVGQDIRPKHSVVAFSYEGQEGLTSADRELFWATFGVPVFEQLLGAGNELIAMECDAHDGLHLVGDFKNLKAGMGMCPCGNPAPRMTLPRRIDQLADLLA